MNRLRFGVETMMKDGWIGLQERAQGVNRNHSVYFDVFYMVCSSSEHLGRSGFFYDFYFLLNVCSLTIFTKHLSKN